MRKKALIACTAGAVVNFLLFLVKLYVGISSASIAIYCDAVNNLGDTLSCCVGVAGFMLMKKLTEKQSARVQSLMTLFLSLFIAGTGIFFVYNGTSRMMYPVAVSYSIKYAVAISATIIVKILLAVMFSAFNRSEKSPVLKALTTDSVLDCFITLSALMGLVLITKLNYAVDGLFAIVTGSIISVSAIKNIVAEIKYLIYE